VSGLNVKPDLRVCTDLADLSLQAAEAVVRTINRTVRTTGKCSIVLAGGTTPRTLYGLLASQFRAVIPWAHVHVFWADERYVSLEDPRSNYRMAKDTLLDHVPCPAANIHPMLTHLSSAEDAARRYERTLRSYFPRDRTDFDLVLLGLGDDGHTASLFPGSLALAERTRWVVAARVPAEPPVRLTLTLPALTRAATVYVLIAGASKARALQHVLRGAADWVKYPAAGVRLGTASVLWWVDRDAAALVGEKRARDCASCGHTTSERLS
jgi:6-phosphogluconolactonase